MTQPYRNPGYANLRGRGLEIGAFNKPAPIPPGCQTVYFDGMTRAEGIATFSEVDPSSIVEPQYLGDLDRGGLDQFSAGQFDYVIASHVIEHVANPIALLQDMLRITRSGGHLVIAAPDKRFTFDLPRALTSFEHLADDFRAGVNESSDDHYYDFLCAVVPGIRLTPPDRVAQEIQVVRRRREHVHVWDSASFRDFLARSFVLLGVSPTCAYEHGGDENQFEYFSVWQT